MEQGLAISADQQGYTVPKGFFYYLTAPGRWISNALLKSGIIKQDRGLGGGIVVLLFGFIAYVVIVVFILKKLRK